ncbi:Ni/Fe hydrogenase subunit alpha [bacterium]|nr:Ni/Fe hydrogenase subunit alpha [bacterium]
MADSKTRQIKVDYLARVEGEGGLQVKIRDDQVQEVHLRIFEPPRLFEGFLRGRHFTEAPDITARICGICPIAYQMSAVHAMENACGASVGGQLRALRRLMYCGEWIESHALHVFMLHAPDFLGYEDAIQMSHMHPELVKDALYVKKVGNEIVSLLGGREIHPVNARVGGFYKAPARERLNELVERLRWARDATREAADILARLEFPDFEQDYEFVALSHPDEYPFCEGRIVSNKGLDFPIEEFYDRIEEEQVPYSTALHSRIRGRGAYHVGPLARFNLNYEKLSAGAREAARAIGLEPPCRNPFKSILARAVEIIYAFDEALRIIEQYEPPPEPAIAVAPRAGVGHGCTEAPRGILYHRYRIDGEGIIRDARIAPPTAQNQKIMESDLRELIGRNIGDDEEKLTLKCEQAIRNYDPCISCSCHFLKLEIDRTGGPDPT